MGILSQFKEKFIRSSQYIDYLRKKGVTIGEDCEIYKGTNFGSEPYLITIGNHVRINSGVQLITHDGGCWVLRDSNSGYGQTFKNADKFGQIKICNNVHIGTNSIIMPGVEIGENSIVACGAVVTRNVPSNSIVGGVPAREIESLNEYAEKVKNAAVMTKSLSREEKEVYLKKYFKL